MERKHPLAECEKCPLQANRCAPTTGDMTSPVAFVSRSPGKHDVLQGRPFAGPSGKVLDYLLGMYDVKREKIITTNIVLCQSDNPPPDAIKACKPRLEEEIASAQLVIAGGTEATSALTKYRAVFSARPFIHHRTSSTGVKQRVIVTNNPALVLRNSDAFPDLVEDFRRAFNPPPPSVFPQVEIINDPIKGRDILRRWLDTTFTNNIIASDLEWTPDNEITCAGFAARSSKAVVFGRKVVSDGTCRRMLTEFYNRSDIRFCWHNGKSDTKVLRISDIPGRVDEDTYLQSVALDERPGYHSLEYLLSTKFGWPDYEPATVKHFKKTGEFYGKTPQEKGLSERELYKYNGWDAAGTFQLHELQNPLLDTDKGGSVRPLYERLLVAAEHFRTVEMHGFHYDVEEACNINEREAIPRMMELTNEIQQVLGHPLLNPNSVPQLKAVLYDEWELKHGLRDAGKKKLSHSTGKEVREEIEAGRFTSLPQHKEKLIKWAATHRQYKKIQDIRSRYIEGLVKRAQQDGKIYCNFNVGGGTVSGRVSSNDPNFQNIIREGYEEIPGIRTLFLPSDGNVILSADFSQAELRTCAKLSGDDAMLGIYRDSSRSLHKERAAAFYGASYTKEEYVKSKNINFGVTYGQGAASFAQMYHMDEQEAQAYINTWWNEFHTMKAWTQEVARQARKDGIVVSPFGHKRRFHLITDDNLHDVEREAVSFKPQNIAAWLTISALIELVDMDIPILATVHDSIVADVVESDAYSVAKLMRDVMESQAEKQLGWMRDDIPFLVDVSIGPNWGDVKEIELEAIAA